MQHEPNELEAVDSAISELLGESGPAPLDSYELPAPTFPECIITGVTLYNAEEGWCKPADLFVFGDRFIVNASGDGYRSGVDADEKFLIFGNDTPYFERRNVYVFPADLRLLSYGALKYIGGP